MLKFFILSCLAISPIYSGYAYGGGGGGGGGRPGGLPGGGGNGGGRGRCDDGWQFFQRPQGGWCMKVFTIPSYVTFDTSTRMCSDNGARLTGIQNRAEFDYLSNLLNTYKQSGGNQPHVGMWIGGRRSAICNTQNCLYLKSTAFYWTDGFTSGSQGFIWRDINPSGNGDCLRLLIDPYGPQLDDVPCDGIWQATQLACGKRSR